MAAKTRLGSGGYGTRRSGSFAGKAVDAGIVADAFLSSQARSNAIKKPGIPVDAAPWLKTILETIVGRRGNRLEVPAHQDLTFSATPTKAECEALYEYVNGIRETLENLLNRLDG
jgi:hypothetical protein